MLDFRNTWDQVYDSGPIYAETSLQLESQQMQFWFEPINTWSNLLFLVILIYLGFKIYRSTKLPFVTLVCTALLFLGFIGGVMYHGTRSSDFWYYLDYIPILLIAQVVALYFWHLQNRFFYGVLALLVFEIAFIFFQKLITFNDNLSGTLFYIPLIINIVLPVVLGRKLIGRNAAYFFKLGAGAISIALLFRFFDFQLYESKILIFQRGSHYLWHVFGALSTFFVGKAILNIETFSN